MVSWKGFPQSQDSWEPEDNLNCKDMIENFMRKVDQAREADTKELRERRKPTDRLTLDMHQKGRRLSRRHAGKGRVHYYEAE